jgi:N6-adenosine-specific RNA methylase IME4
VTDIFAGLPRNHFSAIYADPPWRFSVWGRRSSRDPERHYPTHDTENIATLPVGDLAADDACLFMWFSWPMLPDALSLIETWGFNYKTCAFAWIKGDARQIEFFKEETKADMTLGYWTRANSEVCLLATRGKPKRLNAGVRQAIIEPRREHSRKPDCVYQRIERLVAGPYLELFARSTRPGWSSWGNQVGKFGEVAA